jgi:hypothetical protein
METIITDDDTSMKSNVRWSNKDYFKHTGKRPKVTSKAGNEYTRSNKGSLRYPIPEPQFLADPAHRKKTLRNRLYNVLGKQTLANWCGIGEGDILRVTKNFAYMTRQLPSLGREEWEDSSKAVVEHHFDNHQHCRDFCVRKKELERGDLDSTKVYRCKRKDNKLYDILCKIIAEFITARALDEVGHGGDTNVNESLNNTIAWLAPKNKTFCGSLSLLWRVAMAAGINIMNFQRFFTELLKRLGIDIPDGTVEYLHRQYLSKRNKKEASQTSEKKRQRNNAIFAKLRQHAANVAADRAKYTIYEAGIGMSKEEKRASKKKPTVGCKRKRSTEQEEEHQLEDTARDDIEQGLYDTIDPSEETSDLTKEIISVVKEHERLEENLFG